MEFVLSLNAETTSWSPANNATTRRRCAAPQTAPSQVPRRCVGPRAVRATWRSGVLRRKINALLISYDLRPLYAEPKKHHALYLQYAENAITVLVRTINDLSGMCVVYVVETIPVAHLKEYAGIDIAMPKLERRAKRAFLTVANVLLFLVQEIATVGEDAKTVFAFATMGIADLPARHQTGGAPCKPPTWAWS